MEKTSNINTLPVNPNIIPPNSQSETIEQIERPESNIAIDNEIPIHKNNKKSVKFQDEALPEPPKNINKKKTDDAIIISTDHKLILLAGVLFFIFIDIKFKKYILNILTQIFGHYLKTETGGTSYIGSLFYSLTFTLILYIFNRFVDFTSINFS